MAFFAAWRIVTRFLQASRRQDATPATVPKYLLLLKPAGWLAGLVVVGIMIGAVQFIPFVEVGQANFREGSASLAEIRGWAFPTRRILTLLAPDFFGNPADHQYLDVFSGEAVPFTTNSQGQLNPHGAYTSNWGIKNYVEGGIYLGVLPLFLAFLGLWSAWRRRPERRSEVGFFTILSFLSLAFIFGTPLYAILYYGLPGINQLHSPFRWVFPFSLAVAVLAGYGVDFLADRRKLSLRAGGSANPDQRQFRPSIVTVLSLLAFGAGLLLLAGLLLSRAFYPAVEPAVESIFLGLVQAGDAFAGARAFYSYQFRNFLVLALMLLASGFVFWASTRPMRIGRRSVWAPLLLLVISLDLFIAGYGFNSAVDPNLLDYEPALLQWLEEQPGLWRMTTFTPHGDKPLNANTPWLSGIQDVRGYDSVILKQFTDYMAAIEPQNELQFNRVQPVVNWQSLNSPLLDMLGVKYIISAEQIDLPKLEEVRQGEGLVIYENLAAVPRAFTLPLSATVIDDDPLATMARVDPRQFVVVDPASAAQMAPETLPAEPGQAATLKAAEVVAYGNIEARVQAEIDEPSWLVLNDTYFQGWDAYVSPLGEGEAAESRQEIVLVNGNFRGVALEPGAWEVRFRYSPLSFKLGGLTSFMGVIILVFAAGVWSWRRFYRPQGPLTNTRSIAKNSLAPMTLNLFNKAIDFAYAAFYLRVLGPTDAGKFATAIIIAGWFEIIANWGLNTLIIREVAKDRSQASRYLLNTSILRIGTVVIASIPIAVYLLGSYYSGNALDRDTTLAILLLMFGMVFSGLSQGLAGLYYAYETAEFPAAITTITTILKVGFGVAVLLLGFGFVGLAAVSIVVSSITLIILAVSATRQFSLPGPWRVDFGLQRRMLFVSYPLMLNHLFAVIFFQIDVPLMNQINGDEAVGWYNSAYKWVNAFNIIPSFFTVALFPIISRQVQSSLPDARRYFQLSIKLMLLVSFPLAATTTLLAPIMIGVLGGREFLPQGAIALQLVIWSIPIGWMNSVTNYVLIALGREKRLTWAFIIGVVFNLVANLIFLPLFSFVAAAVITILSEIVLILLFAAFLRPAMPGVGWLKILKRPLAVTAIMLWAMVLGSQVHWLLGLVLGLGVYPVGLWLLRVIGPEERGVLTSILPGRLSQRLFPLDSEPVD
jgi:O-antigen/teichoic acid export membrane protein